ncbi:putative protein-lysine deacylase ABHD14B [Tachypleus tridentatus]|uniref:putative protein-lysine deacylase ABHD14B n=1 Tax=Tachypleus tridentatus TaxID=6853 RepID=UPI003FD51957
MFNTSTQVTSVQQDHMTDFREKHHKFTQLQDFTAKVVCFSASDASQPIESSSSLQGPTRSPRHVKESTSRVDVGAVAPNEIFLNVKVFYREALPKDTSNFHISILLLHRAAFSSKTCLDLGTIQVLAVMGYRTVAMDIPGFGNSERARISNRGEFTYDVVKALNLIRPVVVSPSMSGAFALPYLVKHSTDMGGYVPVAPGATSILERQPCGNGQSKEMSLDSTPTLVVFGEYDRGKNSALLCLLPRSQGVEIPRGNHPAYLTSPGLWHKLLYNFLPYANQLAAETQ